MKITRYELNSKKFKEIHETLIKLGNWSITFNITSKLGQEDIASQYNKALRDIIALFKDIEVYVPLTSISVELNQNNQIHFHCYFSCSLETLMLVDLLRSNIIKYKHTLWTSQGHGWRLKPIDEITQTLKNYIYKDIERTLEFERITMNRFKPLHIILQREQNIIIPKKTLDHKTIDKINKIFDNLFLS